MSTSYETEIPLSDENTEHPDIVCCEDFQGVKEEKSLVLNPNAKAWEGTPEIFRTLYFSFSYNNPITRRDIILSLNRNYGYKYAEKVYVHPPTGGIWRWGKIIFKSCSDAINFLGIGNEEVLMYMNGKPMYFKQNDPKWNKLKAVMTDAATA